MPHPTIVEYHASHQLARQGFSFYALLCELIRQADSENLYRIRTQWPEEVALFRRRYNAPGGALSDSEAEYVRSILEIEEADRETDMPD